MIDSTKMTNVSMEAIVLISTIFLVLLAKTVNSCGGYQLEIEYIRNCGLDNVLELSDNFTVVLKESCDLHFRGCITSLANITSVEIDYTVQKNQIKRSGKKDGCHQLENKSDDVEIGLEILGLPKQCPIHEGTLCMENRSINLSKYKLRMNVVAGRIKGKAVITTDVGKSCLEFSANLVNVLGKILPSIGNSMIS